MLELASGYLTENYGRMPSYLTENYGRMPIEIDGF
jgi:hypothetical protein